MNAFRMPLVTRHEAVELLPRLVLSDLKAAPELRAGTVVTIAYRVGVRAEPVALTVRRHALGSYVGADDRGREIQFHACHVLRIVQAPR